MLVLLSLPNSYPFYLNYNEEKKEKKWHESFIKFSFKFKLLLVRKQETRRKFFFNAFFHFFFFLVYLSIGESAPIPKAALPLSVPPNWSNHINHTMYSGTSILQATPPTVLPFEVMNNPGLRKGSIWSNSDAILQKKLVLGLVTRTGFHTQKGKLVRGILFPQVASKETRRRIRDVMLYVGALTVVALMCVVWYALYGTATGVSTYLIVTRCLDVMTILVPPALPLALTVGIGLGIKRLSKKKIYSTSPGHLAAAGHVDTVCYDKTGTLTLNSDEVVGVATCVDGNWGEGIVEQSTQLAGEAPLLEVLCCCHSLAVHEKGGVIGDVLEVEMVKFAKAKIQEKKSNKISGISVPAFVDILVVPPGGNKSYAIVRRVEYTSDRKRMSAVVMVMEKGLKAKMVVVSKGAPEAMKQVCSFLHVLKF